MALDAGALIEVNEYLMATGRDVADVLDVDKTKIELHINAASLAITRFLGRHICPVASNTVEYFSGDDDYRYFVKGLNIVSLSALYYADGTSWTEMDSSTFPRTFNSDLRKVWLTGGSEFWAPTYDFHTNFKLIYSHGYKRSAVPADIKLACVKLVQRSLLQAEGKEGMKSEGFADTATTYDWSAMPDAVASLLRPYKSRGFGGR